MRALSQHPDQCYALTQAADNLVSAYTGRMPQIAADRIRGIKGAAAYFGGFTRLFPGALCQLYGLVSTHIGILLIESGRMPDAGCTQSCRAWDKFGVRFRGNPDLAPAITRCPFSIRFLSPNLPIRGSMR